MSLYRQTIPPLIKYLNNLSAFLDKGVKFADSKGMQHEEMLNFRLAADMRPLTYQVQSCCNAAKFLPVRLGIKEDIYFEDNETSFDQLQTRISATIDILQGVDETSMQALASKPVIMKVRLGPFKFETGQAYVSDYALPFFHFHLSTAYCILRHLGVEIGALDFFGKDTFIKVDADSVFEGNI